MCPHQHRLTSPLPSDMWYIQDLARHASIFLETRIRFPELSFEKKLFGLRFVMISGVIYVRKLVFCFCCFYYRPLRQHFMLHSRKFCVSPSSHPLSGGKSLKGLTSASLSLFWNENQTASSYKKYPWPASNFVGRKAPLGRINCGTFQILYFVLILLKSSSGSGVILKLWETDAGASAGWILWQS